MAQHYSPRIVQDGLVMCLDASQNKSYPTDLPVKDGLVMWMDAADDATFSYSSGTTVSQWRDKSGFNYHMTPVSAGPTRNSFLNSRKTITITSAQQIGNLSINLQTSANTVFVVSRLTGGANGRVLTAYYNNWLLGHWGGWANAYYAGDPNGWIAYNVTAADTVWRIYMGDWGSNSNDVANAYSNGTLITNQPTSQASEGPKGLGINSQGYELSNCEAAEIIVFNRLLSTSERRLVHTYLGQKWGILNTDRSIIDLNGYNDNGLLGNGATANMPVYNYYNKGGLRFNSSFSNYVISPNTTISGSQTFCVWAVMTGKQNSPTGVLSQHDYASTANFGINILTSNQLAPSIGYTNGTREFQDKTTTATISYNQIFNAVLVYNAGLNRIYWYINGVLDSQYALSLTPKSTNWPIGLGRWDPSYDNYYFDGTIFSALIYNRALSATEVTQNYEAQKSKFTNTIVQQGLVLNLDAGNPYSYAGAGTTWFDVSGNGYNGTLTSSPVYSTDSGGAFKFSGNYSLSPASTVNSLNGDALTVEAWIKHDSFGVAGTGRSYVSNWHSFNTLNQRGFILRTYSDQTNPSFWWCWGGGNNYDAFGPSSYVMQTGKIYHIVATYEKNVAIKIYINGNLEGTGTNSITNTIAFDTTNGVYIGFSNINNSYMDGNIYSARLYNRVLTAAQVLQNYNATKGRFGL